MKKERSRFADDGPAHRAGESSDGLYGAGRPDGAGGAPVRLLHHHTSGCSACCGLLGLGGPLPLPALFAAAAAMALARGLLRYGEQACNHFIAFKLLALLRDKVFPPCGGCAPAKLEGRDKGDLISVITSDIELLEVFYAHTISPGAIALLRQRHA